MLRSAIVTFCIFAAHGVEIEASSRKPLVREASVVMASVDDRGGVLIERSEPDEVPAGKVRGHMTMAGCGKHARKVEQKCMPDTEQYFVDVRCCGANDAPVKCEEYGDMTSLRQKTFQQAEDHCAAKGLHLCSAQTLESQDQCKLGKCRWLDRMRVWSKQSCFADPPTTTPKKASAWTGYVMTAPGCGRPEHMRKNPPECAPAEGPEAGLANVRCCLKGDRKEKMRNYLGRGKKNCKRATGENGKGVTFKEAKELCDSYKMVICSEARFTDNSKQGMCGTGCGLDKERVWTGDWCEGPPVPTTTTPAAPEPAVENSAPAGPDDGSTTGCLMREADGKYAWIQHRDGTYNWVSKAKKECVDKAGVMSSEHISELEMRHTNYALNEEQSDKACKNKACELDTEGCLYKSTKGGYFYVAHSDKTKNWIDNPDSACEGKVTKTVSDEYLAGYIERHAGRIKPNGESFGESYPFPSYNLGKDDSIKACKMAACPTPSALAQDKDAAKPGPSSLAVSAAISEVQSSSASESEWQREMRVRFGADFAGGKAAGNETPSKAAS